MGHAAPSVTGGLPSFTPRIVACSAQRRPRASRRSSGIRSVGPRDGQRGHDLAEHVAHGCGDRRQPVLEFVDGRHESCRARPHQLGLERAPVGDRAGRERLQLARRQVHGAAREEHLAERAGVQRHAAPSDPAGPCRARGGSRSRRCLGAERAGDREVDGLAGEGRECRSSGSASDQDVVADDAALREPQQHRAGPQAAAQAGALQRGRRAPGRRSAGWRSTWAVRYGRQLADGERLGRFHDAHQQLGGTIGRLGSGLGDHSNAISWNSCSTPRIVV